MNKIVVGKTITTDSSFVKIVNNVITFLKDGDYEIEYMGDGEYKLELIIDGNINLLVSSFDNELITNCKYTIKSGSLHVYKFYNNYDVTEIINVDLCSPKVSFEYSFANICKQNEKYELNINHLAENTYSSINNRAISLKNSSIDFDINSSVIKNAIGSVLNQETRIATMGECHTSIKPNMYTPLDDVEAKHGSVIGTFNEDDIFYLMSKGISYNDTLKLLIKGYLLSSISLNHEIRKKIIDIIDEYWG